MDIEEEIEGGVVHGYGGRKRGGGVHGYRGRKRGGWGTWIWGKKERGGRVHGYRGRKRGAEYMDIEEEREGRSTWI